MTEPLSTPRVIDAEMEHAIKNHLAVIVGFCELLISETPDDDPRAADLREIHKSARTLIDLFRRNLKI
jgi:hypothetical protein